MSVEQVKKLQIILRRMKRIAKYLREVSIVVIGVAITFTISNWISSRNEEKDLQRYLDAIKLELENNLETMQQDIDFYTEESNFSRYLSSIRINGDALQADSVVKYNAILGSVVGATYKTNAHEMLKTSGAMRLIKNETLLMSILDCYSLLDEAINTRDIYIQKKLDEIFVLMDDPIITDLFFMNNPTENIDKLKNTRMIRFLSIQMSRDVLRNFSLCHEQIEKTLRLLE